MTNEENNRPLAGKTVLITGAVGGIGQASARRLAEAGASLLLHAFRGIDRLESLAATLKADGSEVVCLQADLTDAGQRRRLLDSLERLAGRIDVFVQAAGVDLMQPSLKSLSFEERLEAVWKLDVAATVALARPVGERMKRAGGGSIVLFGWNEVEYGMGGATAQLYATAKGAVLGFMRSLARELAPEVRVNALSPGWIRTRWGSEASETMRQFGDNASLAARWGEPEEVADAVLFLASGASSFISKQNLNLDGGRS